MDEAWIAGQAVALDAAIGEAARLLGASRNPLIAGLGTDVAGARAAIALAQRTGAAIDHMNADALLRDLDVMRSSGVILTTPDEAQVRADTILLVGEGLASALPQLPQRLFGPLPARPDGSAAERRVLWLCPGRDQATLASPAPAVRAIGRHAKDLPALLAAVRARLGGRPTGKTAISSKIVDEIGAALKAARFGVAVWSAAMLDSLAIEMLCGLINDLNLTTRFCALPLPPGDNAVGVLQACGWLTGFPMRTGFAREMPEHDPWMFDGSRLVASGETDCVMWISAYRAAAPPWREPPAIALTARETAFSAPPRVHIAVGCPGEDHPAVEHVAARSTLAAVTPARPARALSVADAIVAITSALPAGGVR